MFVNGDFHGTRSDLMDEIEGMIALKEQIDSVISLKNLEIIDKVVDRLYEITENAPYIPAEEGVAYD